MNDSVIEVDRFVKRYESVHAAEDLPFSVERGTTCALLGANGAGKTTTIAMLLGLLLLTSGSIRVLWEDMLRHHQRVLPRMNLTSPYVDLPRRLTVRENPSARRHCWRPLYQYSVFELGLPLVSFFTNLRVFLEGRAACVCPVLRYGLGAENLAWAPIYADAPLSVVYYPIAVLPKWLQAVAAALPSSHVFEACARC